MATPRKYHRDKASSSTERMRARRARLAAGVTDATVTPDDQDIAVAKTLARMEAASKLEPVTTIELTPREVAWLRRSGIKFAPSLATGQTHLTNKGLSIHTKRPEEQKGSHRGTSYS